MTDDSDIAFDDTPLQTDKSFGTSEEPSADQSADIQPSYTNNISWEGNIQNALSGVLMGVLFLLIALSLLWWNEGRMVSTMKRLDEGKNLVVTVSADAVSATNEGKLIHISGRAATSEILSDPFFGVNENAIRLTRRVEMYQWQEQKSSHTEHTVGGNTSTQTAYSYKPVWSSTAIDSGHFKQPQGHENPAMLYKTQTFDANNVHVGAFHISSDFINQMTGFTQYQVNQQNFAAMNPQLQEALKLSGGGYFYGDPGHPQIGALRITYQKVQQQDVTVVGQQSNSNIRPYYTKNREIKLLATGLKSADVMFADAQNANTTLIWIIRVGGIVCMFVGLMLLFRPLEAIANVVPFLGDVIVVGAGLISALISIMLGSLVIAIAWIFYRPVIGVSLLVVAVAVFCGGAQLVAKARNAVRHLKSPTEIAEEQITWKKQ